MIKVGQEDMTGKHDSKKVLLKLLLTRAKKLKIFKNWLNRTNLGKRDKSDQNWRGKRDRESVTKVEKVR